LGFSIVKNKNMAAERTSEVRPTPKLFDVTA